MKFLFFQRKARHAVGAGLLPLVSLLLIVNARGQDPASDSGGDVHRMAQQELQRYRSAFGSRSRSSVASTDIDIKYYGLNLHVTTNPDYLRDGVTIGFTSTADSSTSIVLDLMRSMTVDSVIQDNAACSFVQDSASLTITLAHAALRAQPQSVQIFCQGTPVPTGFGSFEFSTHGASVPWVWSLSEPYGARDWWPCKDHPQDKADSSDIIVTCDAAFRVGSNGRLVAVTDNHDGTVTYHWHERYPIASYLISVAITDYASFSNWFHYSPSDSMEVVNYVLPENFSAATSALPLTVDMLAIYSGIFGLYPFVTEKYGHSDFGWGGAMEHQTMTSTTSYNETVISHELGHQWFGDMITCLGWPDIWLNEGFAEYCSGLYFEREYGPASYWTYIGNELSNAKPAVGPVYAADTTDPRILFDHHRIYAKGASVLHMLRHVLGDSVFFRAMHDYANAPGLKYGVASTRDFEHSSEKSSGRDLAFFFDEWVFGENYPSYICAWSSQPDSSGYGVTVRVTQTTGTATPPFFVMPVDIRFTAAGWDSTVVVWNNQQVQDFVFHMSHNPSGVTLDPDGWILKNASSVPLAVEENRNVPFGYALSQNYPNPFNPRTEIEFSVGDPGMATLKVYDVIGREMTTLVNSELLPGIYRISWDASHLPSGAYYYTLRMKNFTDTKKLTLAK
jgi:aminopeptidase N